MSQFPIMALYKSFWVYQLDSNPYGPTLYFRALVKTNFFSLDSMIPWKKGPVDMIDSTCQTHDNCYGEVQNHPVIKSNNFITPCILHSMTTAVVELWGNQFKKTYKKWRTSLTLSHNLGTESSTTSSSTFSPQNCTQSLTFNSLQSWINLNSTFKF